MADQYVVSTSDANMDDYPAWLQAAGADAGIPFSGSDLRHLLDVAAPGTGVLDGTMMAATQRGAGANYSIDLPLGRIVVAGTTTTQQGKFLASSRGTVNLTTPSAPGSGTRTHRVVAEILDKQAAGSSYGWQYHLVEDTGSGLPAAPASSETICSVSIAAGQASVLNANIVDLRKCARHQVGCQVHRNGSTQALTSGTRLAIRYDGEDDDTFAWANVVTDDSTIWVREAGLYDMQISGLAPAAGGEFEVGIYLNSDITNGVIPTSVCKVPGSTSGLGARACGTVLGYHLAAGAPVRAYAWAGTTGMTLSSAYFRVLRREWRAT